MSLKATYVEVGVPDLVIIELDGGIFFFSIYKVFYVVIFSFF